MFQSLSLLGYKVINTKAGQLLFRRNPLGREFVRRLGSLSRLVPLQAPQSVLLDICNACNFRCPFCPTGHEDLLKKVGRPKGLMEMGLFCKIIDDLKAFQGQIAVLSLHKDGEPLLNKQAPRMVEYARKAKVAATLEITTNASRLTPEVAEQLLDAGLQSIRISVEHVSSEGYRKIAKTFEDYDQIVANVAHLHASKQRLRNPIKILVKIVDTGLTPAEKDKFHADFGPISDVCRIEGIMGWSHSDIFDFTLGLNPSVGMDGVTPLKRSRIVCPEPFKMMAINFDGTVGPCCDDWTHGLIVGDLTKESVWAVWNGEKLQNIRRLHLQNRRSELPACASCQYMQGVTDLFDLDDSRLRILERFPAAKSPIMGEAAESTS
jgi:radical SAM protein with 4Fe4S-binding SPASM domain